MNLVNKIALISSVFILTLFSQLDFEKEIKYRTIDYQWRVRFQDGFYAKYKAYGDRLSIEDRGRYQIEDTLITIIRTKTSTAFYEDYPDLDTIVIPYKDTITIDGLKYYKVGGTIKIPKYKPKKERKKKRKEK